jgi:pimeloyl-ACP methyl ester carboxylesterase
MKEGNMTIRHQGMDLLGSLVDELFLAPVRILRPIRPRRDIDRASFEQELNYYIENGYVDRPETFFTLPLRLPEYRISRQVRPAYELITYTSGYEVRNPFLRERFHSYTANQTGCLVLWRHGDTGRKTVLCVHGFMLGDPPQAYRMFRVKKLFEQGLDVALFIHPFHWLRAPGSRASRRIYLQPDDVGFMSECIGQSVYDLGNAFAILKDQGAGEIGIIGASLGGYAAAAFVCISAEPRFAALMVPGINFMRPLGPEGIKMRFPVDAVLSEKIRKVCEMTSPINLRPRIPAENILVVTSRGDRVCPFKSVRMLCEQWGLSRCHFRNGGHWLVFDDTRGMAWYGFLRDMGFIDPGNY